MEALLLRIRNVGQLDCRRRRCEILFSPYGTLQFLFRGAGVSAKEKVGPGLFCVIHSETLEAMRKTFLAQSFFHSKNGK